MKKILFIIGLMFVAFNVDAQTTKKVVVYDSPDHSQWHTETIKEGGYTGHEYSFDLSLLDSLSYSDYYEKMQQIKPGDLKKRLEFNERYQDSLKATYKN